MVRNCGVIVGASCVNIHGTIFICVDMVLPCVSILQDKRFKFFWLSCPEACLRKNLHHAKKFPAIQ